MICNTVLCDVKQFQFVSSSLYSCNAVGNAKNNMCNWAQPSPPVDIHCAPYPASSLPG